MTGSNDGDGHGGDGAPPVVVIVGAGFGGLGCARRLATNGGAERMRVIIVDERDGWTIGGAWQLVWTSRVANGMSDVTWPLSSAELPGVETRFGTRVSTWLPAEKKVLLTRRDQEEEEEEIEYDHVVISCGVVPDPTSIPGIESTVNICSEKDVPRQKLEMEALAAKAESLAGTTGEKATFCLSIGVNPYKCPPAPYELTFLVDEYLRKAGVRENCRVVVTAPTDWTMPPNTKKTFMDAFEERGIEFLPDRQLERVEDGGRRLIFRAPHDGEPLDCDALWTVWPIRAPDFVRDAPGVKINAKGTVTVADRVTNEIGPDAPGAHVIGDACRVPFGAKGVPKAGEFAWKMGVTVADFLAGVEFRPADRSGVCAAEAGFGRGFVLSPDFTDVCNDPENGKPRVGIVVSDAGSEMKVEWVNKYLSEVFGDAVPPLKLAG